MESWRRHGWGGLVLRTWASMTRKSNVACVRWQGASLAQLRHGDEAFGTPHVPDMRDDTRSRPGVRYKPIR